MGIQEGEGKLRGEGKIIKKREKDQHKEGLKCLQPENEERQKGRKLVEDRRVEKTRISGVAVECTIGRANGALKPHSLVFGR